jgi:hypothetical protein
LRRPGQPTTERFPEKIGSTGAAGISPPGQEQATQARYKKAENEELKKAGKAKRLTQIAQNQADTHQQRAEEIHQKAERSWKAYLSLNAVAPANPEVAAAAPRKVEEAAKEPAKAEDAPK